MARGPAVRLGRRRLLQGGLAGAGLVLLTGCGHPALPWAQPAPRIRRVGYLTIGPLDVTRRPRIENLKETLRDLGWVEGRDIVYEPRYPERQEDMPAVADELVRLPCDLIIVAGPQAAQAVKEATSTIPIVMTTVGNALASGLVTNLARPEGNITGFTTDRTQIQKKSLELLTACLPGVSPVAQLFNSATSGLDSWQSSLALFRAEAQTLGIDLVPIATTGPADYPRAFAAMAAQGFGAAHLLPDGPSSNNTPQLGQLAHDTRLPAILGFREFPFAGGLLSFGTDFDDIWRRAAIPVDKILKGARPGDIPVELPSRFEIILNLRTARTFGLTIPQSVLAQATEVVQ